MGFIESSMEFMERFLHIMHLQKTVSYTFKSALILVFVVALLVSNAGIVRADVSTAVVGHDFTIQLKPEVDSAILSAVGSGVHERFSFSNNSTFENIFSFHSFLTTSDIESQLEGKFTYVDMNQAVGTTAATNDPGFTNNALNIDKQWALPKTGFTTAWDKTTGSVTNIVAVIDTGIDETHEDLQNISFVQGYDILKHQAIASHTNSDDNGHGTLITGILGASANNGKGVVGTNWALSVMPIKALDGSGTGDSSNVAEGLVWAADHGAMFMNLSLGGMGFGHDTTLANAISYAFNKGALIVAAAGNDVVATGGNMDVSPVFPVCNDNDKNMVIGVAATDQNDLKSDFSNYGKNCVDVSAPGKRILTTINHDPATQAYAPDSYAYASGTSLAVPYVVGEAALIRSANPGATNVQIRDQIMATADKIDNLNLTQCGGSSCTGLLGAGRINVQRALANPIGPPPINDGDLVKDELGGAIYQISGGQKRRVSDFVLSQRFSGKTIRTVSSQQLASFSEGPFATPLEGTLVKTVSSGTVYIISQGLKLPLTAQVFRQRGFSFANIQIVSQEESNSWVGGNFYPPIDGTLLRTAKSRTVYWVVGGVLHPVNAGFYAEKGLNIFPIVVVQDADIAGFTKGEAFIR